ncbi:MAG: PKD domain-containing protein [Bacteroidota bacterium]
MCAILIFSVLCTTPTAQAQHPGHHHDHDHGQKSPRHFIENKGQWHASIQYATEIGGGRVYFGEEGIHYLFYDAMAASERHFGKENYDAYLGSDAKLPESCSSEDFIGLHRLNVKFQGGDMSGWQPNQLNSTYYNYFYGNDTSQWVGKARAYSRLNINELYQGIDLVYYSEESQLKYDFVVAPGADPEAIRMNYNGQDDMQMVGLNLVIETSVNQITEYRPYAYQEIDGVKQEVACIYQLEGDVVTFGFPAGYDDCYELVIDPLLIFSTYSGSPADNWGNTATFGENGKVYSGGITNHFRSGLFLGEFPATSGAFQTSWGGIWDVAILKYDSLGQNLEYATYLGGDNSETPHSMIINAQNELLVFGTTSSTNFPTTAGSFQPDFGGGVDTDALGGVPFDNGSDFFIAKLSSDGSMLANSTFVGGSGNDGLLPTTNLLTRNYGDQQRGEVFVDANDNVYFAATTQSSDLFTNRGINSFDSVYGGGVTDAVVVKLSSDLSTMEWGGYLGGSFDETGLAVKVTKNNAVFAAGGTNSSDFPNFNNGFDNSYNGEIDGWVAKISSEGDTITSTSFIGTSDYDQAYFLDLDQNDEVYVLGQSRGPIPNTTGLSLGFGQFIQKYDTTLSQRILSATFGGSNGLEPNISLTAFLVNDCDNLYVSGWGNNTGNFTGFNYVNLNTSGLPTTIDAFKTTTTGQDFYLMVLNSDADTFLYGTFFGGSQAQIHVDGGTSRFDKSGIVYHSVCASCDGTSSFPTSNHAWSQVNASGSGCNNAVFKFDLASLRAIIRSNTVDLNNPGITQLCLGEEYAFENFSIGGEVFEWDFGDNTQVTRNDTLFVRHEYASPGQYNVTLRAIDQNTCIGIDVTSIRVNVIDPVFVVAPSDSICVGEQSILWAQGADTYRWTNEFGLLLSTNDTLIVSPNQSARYFVALESQGCPKMDSVDVIVEEFVDVDARTNVPGLTNPGVSSICLGDPILVENLSVGADEYQWNFGDGRIVNTTSTNNVLHTYQSAGVYTITLSAVGNYRCVTNDVTTLQISVNQPPFAVVDDGVICEGDDFILFASGSTQYTWTDENGDFLSNNATLRVSPTSSTTYFVSLSSSECSRLDTVNVEVIELVRVNARANAINLGNPNLDRICFGDALAFENLSTGTEEFQWNLGDGTIIDQNDLNPITHTYSTPGVYTVTLTALGNNPCVGNASTSLQVTVSQPPFAVVDDRRICEGDSYRLEAFGGNNYQWFDLDGNVISSDASFDVSPTVDTDYVVLMERDGCTKQDTVSVSVVPALDIDFTFELDYDCWNTPVLKLTNTSQDNTPFRWDLGDGNSSEESEFEYIYEIPEGSDGRAYRVSLIADSEFCRFAKTVDIDIFPLRVPNVITPDDDGFNDKFEVKSHVPVSLTIYNRWGKTIYENKDYQNEWSADKESSGVYYYSLTTAEDVTCNGWIQVMKQ